MIMLHYDFIGYYYYYTYFGVYIYQYLHPGFFVCYFNMCFEQILFLLL